MALGMHIGVATNQNVPKWAIVNLIAQFLPIPVLVCRLDASPMRTKMDTLTLAPIRHMGQVTWRWAFGT